MKRFLNICKFLKSAGAFNYNYTHTTLCAMLDVEPDLVYSNALDKFIES